MGSICSILEEQNLQHIQYEMVLPSFNYNTFIIANTIWNDDGRPRVKS